MRVKDTCPSYCFKEKSEFNKFIRQQLSRDTSGTNKDIFDVYDLRASRLQKCKKFATDVKVDIMPASEFSWSSPPQLPPFQVYASKRKCDQECVMESEDLGHSAQKRLCLVPQSEPCQLNQEVSQHHMTPFQHEQNQMQAMGFDHVNCSKPQVHVVPSQSWPDVHMPMSDICEPAEMNNNCPDVMPNSNIDLIMNINDETYSTKPHHQERQEQEGACANMDTDFVPNQKQYDPDGDFCKEFCGYGSVSPRSGKVRCYCKPSWEGMLEVRPYLSDVY